MLATRQYRRLTDELREEVARLRPRERVASEPELALTCGVSRFTVDKAIQALAGGPVVDVISVCKT
jgi:DNA-binding GntR family transcriptional regulator